MRIPKPSYAMDLVATQNPADETSALSPAQQTQQEKMGGLAVALFQVFGEAFHLYTSGLYREAHYATCCRYNHDGTMVFGMNACPYDAKGEIDENAFSPPLDRDMDLFFKFVESQCGLQDDLTVDCFTALPERRIIATNPYCVIDLIERILKPFNRETLDEVGLRQTKKGDLSEKYFQDFTDACFAHSLNHGNCRDSTFRHLIEYMPMRSYASVSAACAHGAWASYDKRLFSVSLEKLRAWADSIFQPIVRESAETACFKIH